VEALPISAKAQKQDSYDPAESQMLPVPQYPPGGIPGGQPGEQTGSVPHQESR